MDLSVRLFGLNPWSVLVPQALEGVAAVGLLYAAVRRVSGPGAALLAGAVFALTPVAALMFRFNNPDALLVLMLVAAAYCVQRACEQDASRWWLIAAGAAVGFGFLAKMLQAFLVLPGFAAAYLVAATSPTAATGGRRAGRPPRPWWCPAAGICCWSSCGRRRRARISGVRSTTASSNWRLGYNGFGRLTGDEPGGLGNLNHDVGWGRLFGSGDGRRDRVAAAGRADLRWSRGSSSRGARRERTRPARR